jgi:hypothetical protein
MKCDINGVTQSLNKPFYLPLRFTWIAWNVAVYILHGKNRAKKDAYLFADALSSLLPSHHGGAST